MDFVDACKAILRRWYVAVPLLLLTSAAAYLAYASASANYSAKGELVLTLPTARVLEAGQPPALCPTNAWCFGGDVLSLANVTARTMDDPSLQDDLLERHPGASYKVVLNVDNGSAIVELTTTAKTPKGALATLNELRTQAERELNDRQLEQQGAGGATAVDTRDLVTISPVTMANKALPQSGGKLRAAAAAFGLGIAITLGGVFLAESIAASRRANASLLDRIALPDQPTGPGSVAVAGSTTPRKPAGASPEGTDPESDATRHDRPKPVYASPRRSGRLGS